jgi:hypothetical protein
VKYSVNYRNGHLALQHKAKADGYDAPILLNQVGNVSADPTTCVFRVRDGRAEGRVLGYLEWRVPVYRGFNAKAEVH